MEDEAFKIHNELKGLCEKKKGNDIALARDLYYLKRYDLWKNAVGGIDRWEDYLKQPEIGISRHKADKLIKVYEFFMNKDFVVRDVPLYALHYIAKNNIEDEKIDFLLDDARVLSQADFKERFIDVMKGEKRTYSYLVMKRCNETGNLTKVMDIESDDIKEKFNL